MPEPLKKVRLDKLAAEARANPERSRLVYDSAIPGFFARLRGGRLSFGFGYRYHGKERRMVLGEYGPLTIDDARDLAGPLYAAVRAGGDPLAARQAHRERLPTFRDVAAAYLEDLEERAATGAKRGRRSTLAEFRGLLNRHVLPRLGSKEIAAIDLEDVEAIHRALWKTPATANRALTTLSAVLGFAERRRLRPIGSNPCKLVSRLKESPKAARFSLEELRQLGAALQEAEAGGEITPEAALAFKLLALTGWRRSELLAHALKDRRPDGGGGLRWADIDLTARVALLRDAKSGDRCTPLAAPVVALLAAARPTDAAPDAPVCSGRRPGLPLANLEKPWAALLTRAELQPRGLHSLRRTVGSVAGDLGFGEFLIGALLGHSRAGVTGRYVIPAQDPVREVAERVAAIIAEALLLDSRDLAKVLPMTSREAGGKGTSPAGG
jgi:integrase